MKTDNEMIWEEAERRHGVFLKFNRNHSWPDLSGWSIGFGYLDNSEKQELWRCGGSKERLRLALKLIYDENPTEAPL